jgi:sulfatase maturation enzyme AslB (radical SAM superfamily)
MEVTQAKFSDPLVTLKGEKRAHVPLTDLKTLWFNTGTLCNLECANCYIESSPKNDRLIYLTHKDVLPYLEEIKRENIETERIAFTGGEPFLNPHICDILESTLEAGFKTLLLTNAYRVIKRVETRLLHLKEKYGDQLSLRVSMDHYTAEVHNKERGEGTLENTLEAFKWLYQNGFNLSIAGRSLIEEEMEQATAGFQNLLTENDIDLKLTSENLVIFPEMISNEDVPEITISCWGILNKKPEDQMCATERMVVRKKGAPHAVVQACTLLAYDEQFNMGRTLKEASRPVSLNHAFCSKFCVLGGASCSSTS